MQLFNNINYTSNILYLTNTFITEYDISKANINVLYEAGYINDDIYNYLYSSERMLRQKYVGMLQKNDYNVTKTLKLGIIEAKKKLFEANNIQDNEVLCIKNDAVYVINKKLYNTKFGRIEFVPKNIYTGYYNINSRIIKFEFFYYYNNITKEENLDIKGLANKHYELHDKYFCQILKDLFYSMQVASPEISLRMMKDIYNKYISLQFPVEYYRRFNNYSDYYLNTTSKFGSGYSINNADDSIKPYLDISINKQILLELQKIIISSYFNR